MSEINVRFSDGSQNKYPVGITLLDVVSTVDKDLGQKVVAARVSGQIMDLASKLEQDCDIQFLTFDDDEGKEVYWHSASHIMADAVKMLFPTAKLAIGPSISDGFYYDFDVDKAFVPEDLERIEKKMKDIVEADVPFMRSIVPKASAVQIFSDLEETYKLELLEDIEDETVSIYRHGNFTDLCRGPHLISTGRLKHFKLHNIAGAYWRGDERQKMLQRIYGTAYETKEQLEEHIQRIEEAQKRDHRKLGKELDLFSFHEQVAGPGLAFWHPKGAIIRRVIEDFWKDEHIKRGYQLVTSPPHSQS